MSTKRLMVFVLGCALGFGIAFIALRTDLQRPLAVPPSDEQIGPRVAEILNGKDPLRRLAELGALLPTLGPAAVPALVEVFEAAPLSGGDPELVMLGMWWASFDPQSALAWTTAEQRAQYAMVVAAVVRSWAHGDPKRAFATARELRYPHQRELATEAAISGWDESGKPGLLEAIESVREGTDQQRLADVFARRRVWTLGPAEALRWAESFEATAEFREMMAMRVAAAAAASAKGGPIAAAWATPRVRSDGRVSGYPRRIATRWVARDPEAAMAWLATLPAGTDRGDGVAEAFRTWATRDRQAAFAWIERTELQPWNEDALAVYTQAIAGERPKEAMELAAHHISETELREYTMTIIGKVWTRNDRAAAEAWLAQPGVSERVREGAAIAGRPREAVQAEQHPPTGAAAE